MDLHKNYTLVVIKKDCDYDVVRHFESYEKALSCAKQQRNIDYTMLLDKDKKILFTKGEINDI